MKNYGAQVTKPLLALDCNFKLIPPSLLALLLLMSLVPLERQGV